MMSPASTTSPTFTSGRWLMQVFWFERWNFMQRVDVDARLAGIDLAGRADDDAGRVDLVDHARRGGAAIAAPESRATVSSMPVPTNGASARTSGTAWRCMFEPISARLASSFSRNGISEAATETSCLGLTSISVIWSRGAITNSPFWRAETSSSTKLPSSSSSAEACATVCFCLFHRREVDDLVGDLAVDHLAVRRLDEAVLVDPAEAWRAS